MDTSRSRADYLPSAAVASRLGLKRQTLAKWRGQGKGPRGWFYLSPTRCIYPAEAVEAFILEKAASHPTFSLLLRRRGPKIPGLSEDQK